PDGDRVIAFAACVGGTPRELTDRLARYRNAANIGALLDEEARIYEQKRVKLLGLYAGVAEAVTNCLHWNVLYQPGRHRLYLPDGRAALMPRPDGRPDDWTIQGTDAFLDVLAVSLESQKLAVDALTAVLETQYPDGRLPGWRGRTGGSADRSQPPVGAYVTLKLFERLGDLDLLRRAYPYLQRWHEFWTAPQPGGAARRDGNGDGLLEWGSDKALIAKDAPSWEKNAPGRIRAGWESGQDDLPNWDDAPFNEETGTLAMNCLDLNALYALDAWSLAEMAAVLGRAADAERYRDQYRRVKGLVNSQLWNEREGFYFDRHWDGRFSVHKAASAFFTLLAGIPDEARVQRMLKRLLDPRQFWGDYVIPSVSRDDPAFRPESQEAWRGAVRPWANYLVYQGLKACRQDVVASEFARKSAEMFMRSFKSFGLSPEAFDSLTGAAAGQRFASGGPLAALIAVEECLDFTPHEGFRFGILKPEKRARLSRVLIQGRHYEVEASGGATVLREEGVTVVSVGGGAVVRKFLYSEAEVSFEINALKDVKVSLTLLKRGKYQLLVDGRVADVFHGRARKFGVPGGEHVVLVQLLEDLEKAPGPAGSRPGEEERGR
ncbi:MAG TPA: trehalase family glycosidase, partial [Candidatus Aminicenantes bacterium]|nr:trehalase family glycosidase [Candidatus Aminicenantes bacterium]